MGGEATVKAQLLVQTSRYLESKVLPRPNSCSGSSNCARCRVPAYLGQAELEEGSRGGGRTVHSLSPAKSCCVFLINSGVTTYLNMDSEGKVKRGQAPLPPPLPLSRAVG